MDVGAIHGDLPTGGCNGHLPTTLDRKGEGTNSTIVSALSKDFAAVTVVYEVPYPTFSLATSLERTGLSVEATGSMVVSFDASVAFLQKGGRESFH